MTPLARTAILPATVFTPCLNCAMSGPEGSTLSKPDALPEEEEDRKRRTFGDKHVNYRGNKSRIFEGNRVERSFRETRREIS